VGALAEVSFEALLDARFKTQPWKHQVREFEEGVEAPARALLWQMRTGKSKMMVDTACHLYEAGLIDCVMVFAPNGVHENWIVREVPTHTWDDIPWAGWVWNTEHYSAIKRKNASKAAVADATRRLKELQHRILDATTEPDLLWLTFNNESVTRKDVRSIIAMVAKRRRVLCIWDESSDYRTPGSKRTLMMRALAKRVPYRRILDGTSSHNSPLHLFSQYELLGEGTLGFTKYSDFEARYAVYEQVKTKGGRPINKLSHFQNLDELKQKMVHCSTVVLRSDCEDLPEIHRRVVETPLSASENKAYREAYDYVLKEVGDKKISIREQASRLMKLQQVSSGFVIDEYKDIHHIPGGSSRLEVIADEVRIASGKVIVWCQFQHTIDMVVARLEKDGHKVMQYHGRVSAEEKAWVRKQFQEPDDDHKVIVGQPQAGGRGVDFSAADHVMFAEHGFDAIIREQAKERATKMAGSNIELIDLVMKPAHKFVVDEYILNSTENKVNIADDVAGRGLQAILRGA
jgi:hypothetical protein